MYIRALGIAGLGIGVLFKVMHWPGANVIIVAGGLITLVALLRNSLKLARRTE